MQIRLIENLLIDKPTKYTIQVKENIHLNCELYDWIMYLNHKCDANMQIKLTDDILTFLAAKDINPNEEITFNYLTTEYEMANSFICNCNSGKCYKEIKGFRYLSEQDKYSLLPFIISYLKEKLEIKEINIL